MLQEVGKLIPGKHTLVAADDVGLLSGDEVEALGDVSNTRSFLCIDRVKLFTDGSLGAETAAISVSSFVVYMIIRRSKLYICGVGCQLCRRCRNEVERLTGLRKRACLGDRGPN